MGEAAATTSTVTVSVIQCPFPPPCELILPFGLFVFPGCFPLVFFFFFFAGRS